MTFSLDDALVAAVDEMRTATDMVRWCATTMAAHEVYCGHGVDNVLDEAVRLVLHVLALPEDTPDILLQGRLTRNERAEIATVLRQRIEQRIPLAYLTGTTKFAGFDFAVDRGVLVPRSPIAELIEAQFSPWVDADQVTRILEIGTGSGCIAIACAHYFPDARIVATDVSEQALEVARRNCEEHAVTDRVSLRKADVFAGVDGQFDIIVSNPPYVTTADLQAAPAEYSHEPLLGLHAGADGLDIVRQIVMHAREHLRENGILVVEVGVTRPYVEQAFSELPLTWLEFERGGEGVFLVEHDGL